jgi:uncharacterized protein (TIGR03083 family)
MPLEPLPVTDTRPFFRPLGASFVALLRSLPIDAWHRPTTAGVWRVRDVVAHLVDTGLRRLSFQRDGWRPPDPPQPIHDERDLVQFVNELNRQWIVAADRLSPRVLTDLYSAVSTELADFAESLPLDGPARFPVSWAGEEASTAWFDLGREFTEVWHHQAQVRDAVGAPAPEPRWLHAVLEISVRALPHAYRDLPAPPGVAVTLVVDGAAGGAWTLVRAASAWTIHAGSADAPTASVRVDADVAWRLFFNALAPEAAAAGAHIDGDAGLAAPLLRARAVIV